MRDVPRRRVRLQLPRRFPAVDARQAEVHQDEIGQRRCARSTPPARPSTASSDRDSPGARAGARARRGSARCLRRPGSSPSALPGSCRADRHDRFARPTSATVERQADGEARSLARAGSRPRRSPPISWQKRDTIASPRPVPPYLRVVVTSACVNGSKIFAGLLRRHADAGVGHAELDRPARAVDGSPATRRA